MTSIPAICDRCRSTGIAGQGDFSHLGDLLEFEPVAVKPRVNGWDPEAQRAFIALLAATGSKRRSAIAIGRNANGIDQLLKRPDSASFAAAYDRALAIAKDNGSVKIAQGVADAAARNAALTPPSRLRDRPPPLDEEDQPGGQASEDEKWRLIHNIGVKFMRKVAAERQARLAGEIVAADFFLRQVTMMEVLLDLAAGEFGWDPADTLRELRRGEHGVFDIVATPLADWMDRARRLWWAQEGEPERPPYPDVRFLERHSSADGDYSTYADQHGFGALTTPARGYSQEEWANMGPKQQRSARQKQFDEDAAEQAEWERRAHRQWAARQAAPPSAAGKAGANREPREGESQ